MDLTTNCGLKRKPTTNWNPQSNGIAERVHAVLNDILNTFELEERELDENDPWGEFLSSAAFAIRAACRTALQANWDRIKERRQDEINRNDARENRDRIPHTYSAGDKVLLEVEGIRQKLSAPREGPFETSAVFANGTVELKQGAVRERVNARRIIPFVEKE